MGTDDAFTSQELKEIARRAATLSKAADEPAVRIALGLLAESAENVAKRLPAAPERPKAASRRAATG